MLSVPYLHEKQRKFWWHCVHSSQFACFGGCRELLAGSVVNLSGLKNLLHVT